MTMSVSVCVTIYIGGGLPGSNPRNESVPVIKAYKYIKIRPKSMETPETQTPNVCLTKFQGRPSHGGNEAEIFIIAILGGKEFFLVIVHGTVS